MPKFARPNSYNGKQGNQNWTGQVRFATEQEAAAADSTELAISPATLASAVGALVPSASATVEGVVYLTEGTSSIAYPVATKFYADNLAIAGAPAWSETVSGIGQLSTTAEAIAGTDDNTAITPLKLSQVLAGGSDSPSFTNVLISGTLEVTGLSTLSGSATITTGATALNLASDASTGAVNIGTGAGSRTLTLGNVTGATAIALNSGTGGITLASTGAGDITANSSDTLLLDSSGVLELNSSAGVISIGNDAIAQNINLGTGAAARVITLGNSTGGTQVVLNAGTAGVNIGTNAIAHNISIGNQTGATAVAIDSGTGAITIGTAIAKIITIGNVTGATGIIEHVGTGNYVLDGVATSTYTFGPSTTSGTFNIGGTGANTGTATIFGGTGAQTVNIANSTGGKTISIGTGAGVNAVSLGSTNTTSTTTINSGSGNTNVTGGHLVIASVARTLLVNGGAVTDFIGTGVLTAGTQTIANTNIAAGDMIIPIRISSNSSTAIGNLTYSISAGASFTITSVSDAAPGSTLVSDVSTYAYFIIRPF